MIKKRKGRFLRISMKLDLWDELSNDWVHRISCFKKTRVLSTFQVSLAKKWKLKVRYDKDLTNEAEGTTQIQLKRMILAFTEPALLDYAQGK